MYVGVGGGRGWGGSFVGGGMAVRGNPESKGFTALTAPCVSQIEALYSLTTA